MAPPKITVIHQDAPQEEVGCKTVLIEVIFVSSTIVIAVIIWYWIGV